jgi:chitinase
LLAPVARPKGILAPHGSDAALKQSIDLLRSQGHAVVIDLLGDAKLRSEMNCDRELILRNSAWIVVDLKN